LAVVQIIDSPLDGSSLVRVVSSTLFKPNPRRLDPSAPHFDPNVWVYTLNVDTRNKELTSGRDNFRFGLIATSRFGLSSAEGGVPSHPKAISVAIVSKVPRPLTTWPEEEIEFKANQTQVVAFDLYAPMGTLSFAATPKGDGVLDAPTIDNKCNKSLPGTAECKCVKASSSIHRGRVGRYSCTMTWTPPDPNADGSNRYPIFFSVVNRNSWRSSETARGGFIRYVKVVPSIGQEGE